MAIRLDAEDREFIAVRADIADVKGELNLLRCMTTAKLAIVNALSLRSTAR